MICTSVVLALLANDLRAPALPAAGGPFAAAIDRARERVVKVYGGRVGRQEGYASGILVTGDGAVVTALAALLEAPAVRVVLADGQRFPARVVARDAHRRLALLELEGELPELACFDLAAAPPVVPGDYVITASNEFGVAVGPEPVSVSVGICAGYTQLDARRRAQEYAYDDDVILTDVITANPGAAGGALVDAEGRLVGLIGERVISRRTNTWLNYALPAAEVAAFLDAARRGEIPEPAAPGESWERSPLDVGLRMFDLGGRTALAFVERVRRDSPADRAGVQREDLVLAVGDVAVASCDEFAAALAGIPPGEPLTLLVKRGDEVLSLTIEEEPLAGVR